MSASSSQVQKAVEDSNKPRELPAPPTMEELRPYMNFSLSMLRDNPIETQSNMFLMPFRGMGSLSEEISNAKYLSEQISAYFQEKETNSKNT